MADNIATPYGVVATKDDSGVHFQRVLLEALQIGGSGTRFQLTGTSGNGLLVDVSRITGIVAVSGPLTDAQLRAAALAVSGPLTNAELRAAALPVSGPLTNTELRATPVPVTQRVALTASAPGAAVVGVASGVVLAANANRKGLALINTSANWLSVAFGAAAVLYSGITLAPNGGVFSMGVFDFTTAEVRAIAAAAASNLAIQEFV